MPENGKDQNLQLPTTSGSAEKKNQVVQAARQCKRQLIPFLMRLIPNDRQIYVSARLWHEIGSKVRLAPFIYALHDGIDLSKYGDGLRKFYFTFLILKPDNKRFLPGTYFSKKKREAEIAVAIDYDKALNATHSELIKMMETAYLEGIDMIGTIRLKGDFDIEKFKEDVKAIFSVDKWYELVMEPSN